MNWMAIRTSRDGVSDAAGRDRAILSTAFHQTRWVLAPSVPVATRNLGWEGPDPRTSSPPSQATTSPVVAAALARGQLHVVTGVVLGPR